MTYHVIKRHKRLMIVDDEGRVVYCPPSFLKPVTSRADFQPLLDMLCVTGQLGGEVLDAFESRFNPRL